MKMRIRGVSRRIARTAKELRWNMTRAESLLWDRLKSRKLSGFKFRAQHPLGRFILDFCCSEVRLVVEVDGETHEDRRDQDAARTGVLEKYGYSVIRFSNDRVINDIEEVLKEIEGKLLCLSLEQRSGRPPWPPKFGGNS